MRIKKHGILLTFFGIYVLFSPVRTLQAADSKEIKYKSRDLQKVQEELHRKKQEKQQLLREAEELSQSIRQNENQIKNIEKALLHTRKKNSEISQELAVAKNQHDRVISEVEKKTGDFTSSVQKYYVASLIEGPQSLGPVISRYTLRMKAADLRELKNQKNESGQALTGLIETQQTVRNEYERQQEKLSDVKSGAENKEKLLNKKLTRQEVLNSEVRELERTANELASLIDILRTKVKEEAAAEKKARLQKQTSGQSPILARSLPWPVRGKIAMRFGRHENSGGNPFISNGIVIASETDLPVGVVADGKVLYAGQFMSYGSMVVVEHAGDWFSVYGYLSRWEVEKGQMVTKGEHMGYTRPRKSGGTETYFELRFYGKPVDPLPWLVE